MQALAAIIFFTLTLVCVSTFFQRTRTFAAKRGFRYRRVRYISGASLIAWVLILGALNTPPPSPAPASRTEEARALPTASSSFTRPTEAQAKIAYELLCEARQARDAEIAARHLDPDACKTRLNGMLDDADVCHLLGQLNTKYFLRDQWAATLGISTRQEEAAEGLGMAMAVEHKIPICPLDQNVETPEEPDIWVEVEEIARDYATNEVAADERYKGKLVVVQGWVDSVARDISGDPYVMLSGSNKNQIKLKLYFSEALAPDLAYLRPGKDAIQAVCRCDGKIMFNVVMKDCRNS